MDNIQCIFQIGYTDHIFEMIFAEGTHGKPFLFGPKNDKQTIDIQDFFISRFPVTKGLWKFIMDINPFNSHSDDMPEVCVSWDDITNAGGFLEKINKSDILKQIKKQLRTSTPAFRLPSETEWEYAARGGKNWTDNFEYSGSNDINEVAWYEKNSQDKNHVVGQKFPNQLGIYDLNGNIWEWCQDVYNEDTNSIPKDGRPFLESGSDRVLRGGCHHNWAVHCTVYKRYFINPDYNDGCIGFRLALTL